MDKSQEVKKYFNQNRTNENLSSSLDHLIKKTSKNEDGFKFVISLVAVLGTILFKLYDYVQNNPINERLYVLICEAWIILAIVLVFFLFYLLLRGFSFEVKDEHMSKEMSDVASMLYLITFLILVTLSVTYLTFWGVISLVNVGLKQFIAIFVIMFLLGYLFLPLYIGTSIEDFQKKIPFSKCKVYIYSTLIVFYLYSVFILHLFDFFKVAFSFAFLVTAIIFIEKFVSKKIPELKVLTFIYIFIIIATCMFGLGMYLLEGGLFMGGNVEIETASVHYINGEPIHSLIHVTGPNSLLSVQLIEVDSQNNESKIDAVSISPANDNYKSISPFGKYLSMSNMNYGDYEIFINTNNLTAGRYILTCSRTWDKNCYNKSIFLLNNN